MKMAKLSIFILAVLVAVAVADDVAKPGHCYYEGVHILEGTFHTPPGECAQIKCHDAGENNFSMQPCALYQTQRGCHVGKTDLTKPYPDCCPEVDCSRTPE